MVISKKDVTLQPQKQNRKIQMKIGNIEFGPQPLFLAPMEDVMDIGFRMLCKRFGAAMVYTEFVSAEALVRSIKSTSNSSSFIFLLLFEWFLASKAKASSAFLLFLLD